MHTVLSETDCLCSVCKLYIYTVYNIIHDVWVIDMFWFLRQYTYDDAMRYFFCFLILHFLHCKICTHICDPCLSQSHRMPFRIYVDIIIIFFKKNNSIYYIQVRFAPCEEGVFLDHPLNFDVSVPIHTLCCNTNAKLAFFFFLFW